MDIVETIKKTGQSVERIFGSNDNGDMDILKKLHQEHDEVKDLLKKLVDSQSSAERNQAKGRRRRGFC